MTVRGRRAAWLVAGSLGLVGSQVAHALAYRIAAPDDGARTRLLAETGHAYQDLLPAGMAFLTVAAALGLVGTARSGRAARPPAFRAFAAFPLAFFACQEHIERLFETGAFPWDAGLEKTFLLGLALQLPLALTAYALARALVRVTAALVAGRLVAARARAPRSLPRPRCRVWMPHAALLAAGHGSRGPPPSIG